MEYVLNTEVSMVPERYILEAKLAPVDVRSLALAALLPLPGLDQSGLDGLAGAEG